MSRLARVLLLGVAVVILVVAFIALRPSAKDEETTAQTPVETPTPAATEPPSTGSTPTVSPSPTPRPTVDPGPILTGNSVRKLRFDKGDTVRFRVRAPANDHVHIHGYDIMRDVEAGKVARVSFKATIDGIFEIEFEDSGTQIAELRVDP